MKNEDKNRRIFYRSILQVSARYRYNRRSGRCFLTNLSEGGCLLYCYAATPIPINAVLTLSFNIDKLVENIYVKGKVVRSTSFVRKKKDINYELGIQFIDLEKKYRKAIFNFVKKFLADINKGNE